MMTMLMLLMMIMTMMDWEFPKIRGTLFWGP